MRVPPQVAAFASVAVGYWMLGFDFIGIEIAIAIGIAIDKTGPFEDSIPIAIAIAITGRLPVDISCIVGPKGPGRLKMTAIRFFQEALMRVTRGTQPPACTVTTGACWPPPDSANENMSCMKASVRLDLKSSLSIQNHMPSYRTMTKASSGFSVEEWT